VFETTHSSASGAAVLTISGNLDLSTLSRFRSEVLQALNESGPSIILDLSTVDIFETVSLGVIFEAVKRSGTRDGLVVLANPSERVSNDLELTGAGRILHVTSTVSDAVAFLQSASGG
jgi:anti-sigma B factor antagonist